VTIAFMFGTVIGWTYLFSGRNLPLVIAAHALYDFGLSFPSATVGAPVGYQIAAGLLLIPVLPTSFIVLTVIGVRRLDLPVAILTAPDQQAVDA